MEEKEMKKWMEKIIMLGIGKTLENHWDDIDKRKIWEAYETMISLLGVENYYEK